MQREFKIVFTFKDSFDLEFNIVLTSYLAQPNPLHAHVVIGRDVLVQWNRDCSREILDAPPPPRGGRWKLPKTLARRGLGKMPSGGARWRLQPSGEEIVCCNRHHRCSLKHHPV
jgi:hypothetical protein